MSRPYTPGGRFDAEFETNEILSAIAADLTNPVGTKVQWYVFIPYSDTAEILGTPHTKIDPVYDVGSYTIDGSGGRKWRDSVEVPVIGAVIKQGQAQLNQRGLYAPDVLHLTMDRDELMRHIPDVLDDPDPLDRDRKSVV